MAFERVMPVDGFGSRPPRVAIYVQHLLGIGHLARTARIAKALAATGATVRLVMGGIPLPTLDVGRAEVLHLTPVKASHEDLSTLVHPDGSLFGESDRLRRRDHLLREMDVFEPDAVIVEAFPFGRRSMEFELLPLLAQQRERVRPPLIASSIRDILQESRGPERLAETLDLVHRFFDRVLVHGDERFVSLDESFPSARQFVDKIAYTGLVAPPPPRAAEPGENHPAVVVSVGGGAVGARLLMAAIDARPLTSLADAPWLLLTGPNLPKETLDRLRAPMAAGIVVSPFVPDLADVLRHAALSVSQAGYNTVADILVAGCKAVLVPYAANGETEQSTRARRLAERGLAVVLTEQGLTAKALAAAISNAVRQPRGVLTMDVAGADRTAAVILHDLRLRNA